MDGIIANLVPEEIPEKCFQLGDRRSFSPLHSQLYVGSISSSLIPRRPVLSKFAIAFDTTDDEETIDGNRLILLLEGLVMAQFDHRNVLRFHGVTTVPVTRLYFEAAEHNLLALLRQSPQPLDAQLRLCSDIAMGMEYLNDVGYIHRCLQAKSIFLTAGMVAKIGCFEHFFDFLSDELFVLV